MAITDLTGCIWVANDTIRALATGGSSVSFSVDFVSDFSQFHLIQFDSNRTHRNELRYQSNYVVCYGDTGEVLNVWNRPEVKSMSITGGADATNSTLIAYMQENGQLIKRSQAGPETWVIGSHTDYQWDIYESIGFTSGDTHFALFNLYRYPDEPTILKYGSTTVAASEDGRTTELEFYDDKYKTAIFDRLPTGDLLYWLLAYARILAPTPQLEAPTGLEASGTTISFNPVENAESYEVFADGVSIGGFVAYAVTAQVTNATVSPTDAIVTAGGAQQFSVSANGTSYKLPTSITVAGTTVNAGSSQTITGKCTVLYTRTSDTSGSIELSSIAGNVSFSVVGEAAVRKITLIHGYGDAELQLWDGWDGITYATLAGKEQPRLHSGTDIRNEPTTATLQSGYSYQFTTSTGYWIIANGNQSAGGTSIMSYDGDIDGTPVMNWGGEVLGMKGTYGSISATAMCFVAGTKILLSDNSVKCVEDIKLNDEVLCWDFKAGKQSSAPIIWIAKVKRCNAHHKITLSDGTVLKLVGESANKCHRLFNYTKQKFMYPYEFDIDDETIDSNGKLLTIVSKELIFEEVTYYNIASAHMNVYANNILASNRLNNMYVIEDMKFTGTQTMSESEVSDYKNHLIATAQSVDVLELSKYN